MVKVTLMNRFIPSPASSTHAESTKTTTANHTSCGPILGQANLCDRSYFKMMVGDFWPGSTSSLCVQ